MTQHLKNWTFIFILTLATAAMAQGDRNQSGDDHAIRDSWDQTTGEETRSNHQPWLSPLYGDRSEQVILWDLSHGVYRDYEPDGRFSAWMTLMESKGYRVVPCWEGVTAYDQHFDILVISTVTSWETAYSPKETGIIADFVAGGGSLLLMGDNANTPNDHLNGLALQFGVNLGLDTLQPFDLYFQHMSGHHAVNPLEELHFRMAGRIRVNAPTQEDAWTHEDQAVLASTTYGRGRVFLTADCNFMDNSLLGQVDNQLFVERLFQWLAFQDGWGKGFDR